MARVLRGDIVWADLNPVVGHEQAGLRPVLVVSRAAFNVRSGTVIAVPVTSQPGNAGFPLTLEITTAKLPKKSWAKIGQVRTLSTQRIRKRLVRVKPEEVNQIVAGLNEIISEGNP